MNRLMPLLALLGTVACNIGEDLDNDGFTSDVDCDDLNESIGAAVTWVADADGDGWGGIGAAEQEACDRPTGFALRGGDCNDEDPGVSPGANEACNGLDDDCDDFIDENTDKGLWFADTDGDGFGDPETATDRCDGTGGFVTNDRDCNDGNADVKPGTPEVCDDIDNDCDSRIDEADAADATTWFADADGDNFGRSSTATVACDPPSENWAPAGNDCNDDDPAVNPGAAERCDAFDNNCDGKVDDDAAVDATTWYADDDGDAYGDDDEALRSCRQPAGYISVGGDCNDRDRNSSPETLWFADIDSDGFGDPENTIASCEDPSSALGDYVDNQEDCDDTDKNVNPSATEKCDGIDNDCDGTADGGDATDAKSYYMDFDEDGFGDPDRVGRACSAPPGFTTDRTDCNDDNGEVYPGADEFCDRIDNDCDTLIDRADPDVKSLTWYLDADGDSWGRTDRTTVSCEKPTGYVIDDGDCDDANFDVNPDAIEVCDAGLDNDCDGLVDRADPDMAGDGTWYRDADADTYGNAAVSVRSCSFPTGYVRNDDDCDDADATKWNTCWAGPRNFNTCGASGHNGPTSCPYTSTTLAGEVTVSGGKQRWVVPQDGTYRIEAWGAQGKSAMSGRVGGNGARMRGDFSLKKGDVLFVAVGHEGRADSGSCNGGGGGGSWVVDASNNPLVIAGGGSGTRTSASGNGCPGRTTEYAGVGSGSSSSSSCGVKSTALGLGGIVSSSSWGSGGGGMNGNGTGEYSADNGGKSWGNNLTGGGNTSYQAYGGYGGGGAGNGSCGGGGGGGYSGGDGGWVGGGGGSYNKGSNQSNSEGVQTGAGKVTIDWIGK